MTTTKPSRRATLMILAIIVAAAMPGCVALNVPSQRHHDPSDAGGILGHWKSGSVGLGHRVTAAFNDASDLGDGIYAGDFDASGEACIDGGSLGYDPSFPAFGDPAFGDPAFGGSNQPAPPEIPWPRYHPLPTRPIFGSAP